MKEAKSIHDANISRLRALVRASQNDADRPLLGEMEKGETAAVGSSDLPPGQVRARLLKNIEIGQGDDAETAKFSAGDILICRQDADGDVCIFDVDDPGNEEEQHYLEPEEYEVVEGGQVQQEVIDPSDWQSVPLSTLDLPDSLVQLLADADLNTVGDMAIRQDGAVDRDRRRRAGQGDQDRRGHGAVLGGKGGGMSNSATLGEFPTGTIIVDPAHDNMRWRITANNLRYERPHVLVTSIDATQHGFLSLHGAISASQLERFQVENT